MGDDVSTRFSDDGLNDRVPPEPGSRMRVLAVMGAVVVGCGISAVTVGLLPDSAAEPRIGTQDGGSTPTVPAVPDGGAGHTYLVPTDGKTDDETGTSEPDGAGDPGPAPGRGGSNPDGGGSDPVPRDDGAGEASPTPTRDDPEPTSEPPAEPTEPDDPPPPTTGDGDDGGDSGGDEDDGCWLIC